MRVSMGLDGFQGSRKRLFELMCLSFSCFLQGLSDVFGPATKDKMEELCLIMCLVGLGATFAATLQGACFKIFSELQAFKWLVKGFSATGHGQKDCEFYLTSPRRTSL